VPPPFRRHPARAAAPSHRWRFLVAGYGELSVVPLTPGDRPGLGKPRTYSGLEGRPRADRQRRTRPQSDRASKATVRFDGS